MRERPKNIGELFKESLDDLEVNNPTSDWSMLEMKVEKLKFFKFGFTYFNIYYASLIALTFLFSSGVLVDYFFISKSQEEISSQETELSSDYLSSINEVTNDFSVKSSSPKKGNGNVKKDKNTVREAINADSTESTVSIKDTVAPASLPIEFKEVKSEEKKKVPQKKVVYITRQDTVIVMDTIKTKNKKKFK